MCTGLGALLHAVLTNTAHGMGNHWLRAVVQEFQPKLAKVQDFPWSVATADDAVRHIPLSQLWPVQGMAMVGLRALVPDILVQGVRRCPVFLSPHCSAGALYIAP